jgi:hypothetical protein
LSEKLLAAALAACGIATPVPAGDPLSDPAEMTRVNFVMKGGAVVKDTVAK